MKLFSVWRFMEVEIATENFVCSLTGKHHFDAHGFDFTPHQEHGSRSTNRSDIISFDVVNHITNRIKSLLNGVSHFVVHGTNFLCNLTCGFKIWSPF
ncbi:Uncharacterised protein [Vibrio cholerae]|nr:Uncharacterised protein [Vibrio cholerae]